MSICMFALSEEKKAMLDIEKIYKFDSPSIISGEMVFNDSNISTKRLDEAINRVIELNDIIRTGIIDDEKETIQPYVYETIEIIDLTDKTDKESDIMIKNYLQEKLINNKLYSFRIVKYNYNRISVIIKLHHIISDAWTMVLIGRRINFYYNYKDTINVDKGISYKEYVMRKNSYRKSGRYISDRDYWINELSSFNDCTNKLFKGKNIIDNDISIKANRKIVKAHKGFTETFCKNHSISLFNFYMAVLALYMARMNNKDKVVIGTPVLGRKGKEKYSLGYYVNMVPLKININMEWTFIELLREVKQEIFNALKHSMYPYMKIRKYYQDKYGVHQKIFDVVLSYQNAKNDNKDYTTRWFFNNTAMDGLEIHISNRDSEEKITYEIDYQINKYTNSHIEQIVSHMGMMINDILSDDSKKLRNIDILTEDEKNVIINKFNDTKKYYDDKRLIHELFMEQVKKTPNKNAVIFKDESMTYKVLDEKSNTLAVALRKNGVMRNQLIAMIADSSIYMIIGILGILKAGGAYLPIETNYPTDRIKDIVGNAHVNTLVVYTKEDVQEILYDIENVIHIADEINKNGENTEDIHIVNDVDDLAYMLYTSGSAGKPKGIMTTHKNVAGYINAFLSEFHVKGKNVLQQSSYTFDVFTEEVFPALVTGGTLVIVERETVKNTQKLIQVINDYKIQVISSVPPVIAMINKHMENINTLELIISGGDVLKDNHVDNILKNGIRLYNTYGPTETTVCASYNECSKGNVTSIGYPIANYEVYIMDDYENLMPIGYEGEIVIGGVGVTKGYINDEMLTKEKFVKSPFYNESMIYKSGDRGRFLSDGSIEFLGRLDRQIKILGNRIELDEIENMINDIPEINKTRVVLEQNEERKQMICYYTSTSMKEDSLKGLVKKLLPSYMIPNQIVRLESFPLTTSGKINMQKLRKTNKTCRKHIRPLTPSERTLARLYEETLHVKKIGITDDFFELGGDSLKAMEFIIKAEKAGIKLTINELYNHPTIEKLIDRKDVKKHLAYEGMKSIPTNKIIRKDKGDILLTGATGWLGSHLVHELLKNTKYHICCIIRGKNPEKRLDKIYSDYFTDITAEERKRIKVISGDITLNRLGLKNEQYDYIKDRIKIIINAAAYVKYVGKEDTFYDNNVIGTRNIIDVAKDIEAELYHMSTISISGQYLTQENRSKDVFTEKDIYVGQNLRENPYLYSKFLAEKEVIKEIDKGLNASIIRLGNLTQRLSDGKFQNNIEDNGFYGRLKELLMIKKIPRELLNQEIEITPVDECSNAIVAIIMNEPSHTGIYHLYNPNKVKVEAILQILNRRRHKLLPVSLKDIFENNNVNKSNLKHLLSLRSNKKVIDMDSIKVVNHDTISYLQQLGFKWSRIDEDYLIKIIKNTAKIGAYKTNI
ncbi:hypothetical protein SH1V18_20510 [Vallitalea longa]|uniref:Carrier domain-containing protein n=1 Tax=Vallitalea longa TaxID=2936439 RepID=A0A9W5YBF0_9FIRM|nr:amino acid adenylation domain-containing protein [Vallitalea longa]GKX29571.1 hypothetical protein SH1V18_20510 [Vallitalea longa]